MRSLKEQGITLLFISHKLDEIFEMCDRVSILRDGTYIMTADISDITKEELIQNMVGRDVSSYAVRQKPSCVSTEVVLKADHLCGVRFFRHQL